MSQADRKGQGAGFIANRDRLAVESTDLVVLQSAKLQAAFFGGERALVSSQLFRPHGSRGTSQWQRDRPIPKSSGL